MKLLGYSPHNPPDEYDDDWVDRHMAPLKALVANEGGDHGGANSDG